MDCVISCFYLAGGDKWSCHNYIISQHRLFSLFQSSTIPVISTEMEAAGSAMPLSQRVRTYTECLLVILMTCCFAGATYMSVNVAGP